MNYSLIVLGLICLIIGILIFLYAEKLRWKNEIDTVSFKFYISSLILIYAGIHWLYIELIKII